MAFIVSPGVLVTEIDLSNVIPSVATTNGAFVGCFNWGPVEDDQLISSETELVAQFGKPSSVNFKYWFLAANFLAYANSLRVVRTVDTDAALNASNHSSGLLIKNQTDYDAATINASHEVIAKYPGLLGNGLVVSYCDQVAFSKTFTASSVTTTVTPSIDGAAQCAAVGSIITRASDGEQRIVTQVNTISGTDTLTINSAFSTALSTESVTIEWAYKNDFGVAPGTSDYAAAHGGSADEIHMVVVDGAGLWTGVAGTILEKFAFASKASDAKNADGTSNYFKDVLNNSSKYVWFGNYPQATGFATDWTGVSTKDFDIALGTNNVNHHVITYTLAHGVDGSTLSEGDLERGYDMFISPDDTNVSLVIGPPISTADSITYAVANYIVDNIAEVRKDCVAFISPKAEDVINNSGNEADDLLSWRNSLTSSSYAVLDSGWKYQYDKYNDVYRWVPLCGDIAGLCARTDFTRDPWWSPAGLNRGIIKNVVKLAWNPNQAERDAIYPYGINPVVSFPGQGTVLWGDRTLLAKPSSFDRINVRRLFIVLEKAISIAAKYMLFEFNDETTRSMFRSMVEPYLRDVQGRRGITNFKVVCDSTNNTAEVIGRNEFIGDLYIVPNQSINFIKLNFISVRGNVSFDEIVGRV